MVGAWNFDGVAVVMLVVGMVVYAQTAAGIDRIVFDPDENRFKLFPITNYVNTAFDTAQVSLAFRQDGYWPNHEEVLGDVIDPFGSIERDGGFGKFVKQEFLSTRTLPNITLHLIGNGYDFRALAEWYDHHAVPYPYAWAFLSSYAGYLGNEAIEASNDDIDSLDHLADLYFFNLFGNLMFMNDRIADGFHNGLQMRNWAGQPFVDVERGEILNASNNYVMRPTFWGEEIRPFVFFGLHYFGGVSFAMDDASSLSFGAGLSATDPLRETEQFNDHLKKIQPSGGIFWDRDDQLLASVIFNSTNEFLVRANLYPKLLNGSGRDLGIFLGLDEDGMPSVGMIIHKLAAVGFR